MNEILESNIDDNASHNAEYIDEAEREALVQGIENAREDYARMKTHLDQLITNFPDLQNILDDYPAFGRLSNEADELITQSLDNLTADQITQVIYGYNYVVTRLNTLINQHLTPDGRDPMELVTEMLESEQYQEFASQLPESDISWLEDYTSEMLNELFPTSYIEQALRTVNGEITNTIMSDHDRPYDELTSLENLMIAPAVGIERSIIGLVALFDSGSRQEIINGLNGLPNLTTEDLSNILSLLIVWFKNMEPTERAAKIVALAYTLTFIGGIARHAGASARAASILSRLECLGTTRNYLRLLPAAAIAGLSLNIISTVGTLNGR